MERKWYRFGNLFIKKNDSSVQFDSKTNEFLKTDLFYKLKDVIYQNGVRSWQIKVFNNFWEHRDFSIIVMRQLAEEYNFIYLPELDMWIEKELFDNGVYVIGN